MRGLVHLRAIPGNIGVIVLPDQVALSAAHEALDGAGQIKDTHRKKQIENLARTLAEFLVRHQK